MKKYAAEWVRRVPQVWILIFGDGNDRCNDRERACLSQDGAERIKAEMLELGWELISETQTDLEA